MTRPTPGRTPQRRAAVAMLWAAGAVVTALASWSSTQAYLGSRAPTVLPTEEMPGVVAAPPDMVAQPLSTSERAAPAAGVTGTTALPPPPEYARFEPLEPATSPAPPFSAGGVAPNDRARALECLAAAVHYEAASEGDAGQRAVAQVVLNRVRHPAFPATVCGVVFQGSERRGCQFSFACDGSMRRPPGRAAWARAARNAAAALAGGVYAPVGLATHYHTYAVAPAWNRGLVMTGAVGAHLFHRWRGWWGTAAAFRRRYAGGEPVPGPHLATEARPPAAAAAPVVEAVPVGPTAVVAPPPPPAADRLPPAPEVLERWKDAGAPLR